MKRSYILLLLFGLSGYWHCGHFWPISFQVRKIDNEEYTMESTNFWDVDSYSQTFSLAYVPYFEKKIKQIYLIFTSLFFSVPVTVAERSKA
jgi:hypothetical protein